MFDFSSLTLVKDSKDFFIGIRKSSWGDGFEFCLPNGFNNFPEGNFDAVRDLFFKMYRTFRKFERDNLETNRLNINQPNYQQEQDQTTLSSGGVNIQTEEGEACILYSKIKMIERVLEAYDDLAINSIQKKLRRSEEIDYSLIDKYLDRAIYLDNDLIYIETMNLPRPTLRYESTDIVNLYCYILDEIVEQLNGDVPDNIKARSEDIRHLSQGFKDDYLTSNQSIFDKDTFPETINILKEALDNIDKNTYYKDADYWGLYEAIETFLYGELNPNKGDGEFWGIHGFSLVWEDMCNTYFFKKHHSKICYADTDIALNSDQNPAREEEKNRVGNRKANGGTSSRNQWVYSTLSNISKYPGTSHLENFYWDELICIEFDLNYALFAFSNTGNSFYSKDEYSKMEDRDRSKALRRFLRPDIILEDKLKRLKIIDYKDVPLDFYINENRTPQSNNKYIKDIMKQLTYEYALQQTHEIYSNEFFIPYYYNIEVFDKLGEYENKVNNLMGIKVFRANFSLIQATYLEENL